ncbi:MAG: hypothetical protein ACT4PZ_15355 [Panacagrimonas sp.]
MSRNRCVLIGPGNIGTDLHRSPVQAAPQRGAGAGFDGGQEDMIVGVVLDLQRARAAA